jgi:hypothetical protein
MIQMDNAVIQIRMATALKQMASVNQERPERALPCGQLAKVSRCQLLS